MPKKIRLAFIGCGRIAFHHENMLKSVPQMEIVACCDAFEDKAKALAATRGFPWYTNYHEMLSHEDIDAITLCTPTGAHFFHAKDILNSRPVHLIIEKPMFLKVTHALEIKRLADNNNVGVFPVYQHRFNKAVERVKQALATDELGSIVLATVRVRWCRPQRYYSLANWRGTYSMDGGAYTNQGIHFIDLLRYLAGEVETVNSVFTKLGAKLEAEDTGVSIVKFEKGGLGVLEITTAARPSDFEASLSIVGSKGLAVIGGLATNKLVTFSPKTEDEETFSEEISTPYGYGHRQFYAQLADTLHCNKTPPVEFKDGLETIRLLHSLYRSNEEKRWVYRKENLESNYLGQPNEKLLAPYLASTF